MTYVSSISGSAYIPPPAPAPAPQPPASTDNSSNVQAQQQTQATTTQPVYSAINNANASTIRGSGIDVTA